MTDSIKKRIAINSVANVSSHFLRLFISIFLTPFLLSRLGAEVYGIIPLVNSCTSYLVLVSGGIRSSVGRYVTLHIAKGEFREANQYLTTAFTLLSGLIAAVQLPFIFLVIYFPTLFEIPAGHETEARLVMLMLGLNLFVGILFSPLEIGIYAKQRFDLRNLVDLTAQIVSFGLVVFAFLYIEANIMYLAGSMLFVTLISTVARIAISKRLLPTLRVSPKLFDRTKLKAIGTFSFWVVVSQLAAVLFLNTDYIVINKLLGSALVTEYSLAARWNEMIRAVLTAAVVVIAPTATHMEANRNFEQLRTLLLRGMRIMLILVIPPCVLLCIFSRELLTTWVGVEHLNAIPVFWASLVPLAINLAPLPAFSILTGMGKIKSVAIVTLCSAVANLFFSIGLVVWFDLGIMGVALGTSISLSLKNTCFIPMYITRILKMPVRKYYGEFVRPLLSSVPIIILAVILQKEYTLSGWIPLLSASALCSMIFVGFSYLWIFKDEDRADIKMILTRFGFIKRA
jgi:membrane protein EpsK